MDARDIVAQAQAVAERRDRAHIPADYAALNKMVKRQRAALTRAINSGDKDKVVLACRDAVKEWNAPGAIWPDDWSRWQRALDDCLGWRSSVQLEDLCAVAETTTRAEAIHAADCECGVVPCHKPRDRREHSITKPDSQAQLALF